MKKIVLPLFMLFIVSSVSFSQNHHHPMKPVKPSYSVNTPYGSYAPPYGYHQNNSPYYQGGCHPIVVGHHSANAIYPMRNDYFVSAFEMIQRESFDNNKLLIAKQVSKTNYMTSQQISQFVSLFTFETNKLEFAKFAYQYCYDRQNYFIINNVFTFNHSKRELHNYMLNFKG